MANFNRRKVSTPESHEEEVKTGPEACLIRLFVYNNVHVNGNPQVICTTILLVFFRQSTKASRISGFFDESLV